jgi:outer membrane lipoprotein SlyB
MNANSSALSTLRRPWITVLTVASVGLTSLTVVGCASTPGVGPGVYKADQVNKEQKVRVGTIIEIRRVSLTSDSAALGAGALAGAGIGAIAGSRIQSKSGVGADIAGVLGAVVGKTIGQRAEQNLTGSSPGLEISVQLANSSDVVVITQPEDAKVRLNEGDPVRVLSDGKTTRVEPLRR